ncbi:MAG: histidinol dehydrogenase, partial [Hyphomicrobiaceae bacterium]|nr:histidinol dehydrogenase [Hyphomicrobiaceae bacterium]
MPMHLKSTAADFEASFAALLAQKREVSTDVDLAVRAIIDDVRVRGDAALIDLSKKFDAVDLGTVGIKIGSDEVEAAVAQCSPDTIEALKFARDRIRDHHVRQLPQDDRYRDEAGVELGHRWTAVESVGLYVPGGLASYPSSVLMNAVPANVAGVPRIVMVVPTPRGELNPLVLAAAQLSGVEEIYRVGGAQAVAAL